METLWFNVAYYESLGDIFTKYSYLDLTDEVMINIVDDECFRFLSKILINSKQDIYYFSYDLKYDKIGDMITILPENIICALWFIGIFPKNVRKILEENRFENQNFIYTFDKKNCKLRKRKRK